MGKLTKRISELERYNQLYREAWEDIAATVVKDIVNLFLEVNKIGDAAERQAEFLRRGDELMIYAWESRFGGQQR